MLDRRGEAGVHHLVAVPFAHALDGVLPRAQALFHLGPRVAEGRDAAHAGDDDARRAHTMPPFTADHLAGDVGRALREQECHRRRDLFRCADPSHRHHLQHLLERRSGDHLGSDRSRRDAVDGDPAAGEFDRERLRRSRKACFSGAVVHLAAVAHHARNRGEHDDASALASANHGHDQRPHHVVEAVEAGVEYLVPIFVRKRDEGVVARDACVDHHGVIGAVLRHVGLERGLRRGAVLDVELQNGGVADLGGDLLRFVDARAAM
jgi:hypothetical protein